MNNPKSSTNNEVEYPISLSKFLSVSGVASRRKSTELIKNGKVKVNNNTVMEPGFKLCSADDVIFDGKAIVFSKRFYIMLNKPRGYVCTADDPFADKKAIDLVQLPNARLFTAGRLDKDSEGLIILTNDGEYAAKLTHPKYQTQKTYKVTVNERLSDETLKLFCLGVKDEGDILKAKSVERESEKVYIFTLTEGKNREIRRMIRSAQKRTIQLKRIATGKLSLDKLKKGEWRHLSEKEIALTLSN